MIQGDLTGLASYTARFGADVQAHWAPAATRMYQATLAGRIPGPFTLPLTAPPTEWGLIWYLELAAIRAKYQGEG